MPIFKGVEQIYKVVLEDQFTKDLFTFFCRKPTTSERVGYQNTAVKREDKELKFEVAAAQAFYGQKILTGIAVGDFLIPKEEHPAFTEGKIQDENGFVTISSEKDSEYYHPDWRKIVGELVPDMMIEIGNKFFEVKPVEKKEKKEDENP